MGFGTLGEFVSNPKGAIETGIGKLKGGLEGGFDTLTGKAGADAAKEAAAIQAAAIREGIGQVKEGQTQALGFLSPYQQAGAGQLAGITSLVSDPMAQKSFIQNNPFFQSLAGQASNTLMANEAARGKVGSGGTKAALQDRLLQLGPQLLQQSINQRMGLAGLGANAAGNAANVVGQTSGSIADLIGSAGAAEAGGIVGAANAQTGAMNNLMQAGTSLGVAALLSDKRMKKDIERIGEYKSFPLYKFSYIWEDKEQIGLMAQDVEKTRPDAVIEKDGIKYIDYGVLNAH